VTGEIIWDSIAFNTSTSDRVGVTLPGVAPVALTNATVNIANAGADDSDVTCTGTAAAPTAPPGKVCIYVNSNTGVNLASISGGVGNLPARAFWMTFTPNTSIGGADALVYATWAYTAP
jgi:hypothetical protein